MKIRITKQLSIPLMDVGNVYDVETVTESRGERIYFVHHIGNSLGIQGSYCEEIVEESGGKT